MDENKMHECPVANKAEDMINRLKARLSAMLDGEFHNVEPMLTSVHATLRYWIDRANQSADAYARRQSTETELLVALMELTCKAESSLDYRPEFRRAISSANAAIIMARCENAVLSPATNSPAGYSGLTNEQREAMRQAIAESLGDAYDCHRAWSAWGNGTMGPEDFWSVACNGDRLDEITQAVFKVLATFQPPNQTPDANAAIIKARGEA